MSKVKLLAPAAALAIGAMSMVGVYAFADTKAPAAPTTTAQVSSTTQTVDDQNKGTDVETADDNGSTSVSDTDKEINDDGAQATNQNSPQDPGQTDSETNDGN